MIYASCQGCYFGDGGALYPVGYWITASVPARIHQGARCPAFTSWPLCLHYFPLCAMFSCELSNTSNSYLKLRSFLPTPRGNQDTPGFGSTCHTSCPTFNCFSTYICNFYVTTYTIFSKLEKLWSHKCLSCLLLPTPFFNARLLTHLEQPASVPVFFQHDSFQSGKFSGSLGFTCL